MLITPFTALAPHSVAPGPLITSTRSMSSSSGSRAAICVCASAPCQAAPAMPSAQAQRRGQDRSPNGCTIGPPLTHAPVQGVRLFVARIVRGQSTARPACSAMPLCEAGPRSARTGGAQNKAEAYTRLAKPALSHCSEKQRNAGPGQRPGAALQGEAVGAACPYVDRRARHSMRSETHSQIAALRAELQARNASLDAAYKELDLLCYAVSHDLRAPLRAIDGFTRMLLDRTQGRL